MMKTCRDCKEFYGAHDRGGFCRVPVPAYVGPYKINTDDVNDENYVNVEGCRFFSERIRECSACNWYGMNLNGTPLCRAPAPAWCVTGDKQGRAVISDGALANTCVLFERAEQ